MFNIPSLAELAAKNIICYGIDLGTSYTVVSCINTTHLSNTGNGSLPVKMVQIDQLSPLVMDATECSEMVASILAVGDNNGLYVGNKLHKLKANPDFCKDKNIFYHWKLDLGVSVKPLYPEAVRPDIDDAAKVAGKILNYCRIHTIGKEAEWENVIITVPASFQANQRTDVIEAAKYAKIAANRQMLVDEPNAAFLGYLNQLGAEEVKNMLEGDPKNILVIDFGGGTCDLSALTCSINHNINIAITNTAISRYNDLGGQDLDMIIAEKYLLDAFLKQDSDLSFTPEELENYVLPQLAVMGEKLKIDLCRKLAASFISPTDIQIDKLSKYSSKLSDQVIEVDNEKYEIPKVQLSAEQLNEVTSAIFRNDEYQFTIVDKVIQSIPGVVDDIFKKSNWSKEDLHYVLLVGGSIQNPLFIRKVMELLEPSQVIVPQRPDTLVSAGAAIFSFFYYALNQTIIQPICSETIGVITLNSDFYPLIESGVQLPHKARIPTFTVQNDYQTLIEIPFCINSRDNIVGILRCPLSEIVTKTDTIEVEVGYSVDKVIDATVLVNGKPLGSVTIAKPMEPAALTPQERRLAEQGRALEAARAARDRNAEREILRGIIWEFYNVSNYTRSIAAATEYLNKFNKNDAYVWNILYCSYIDLGQRKKAAEAINKAIEISPNTASFHYNNSLLIERTDGSQEALNYLNNLPNRVLEDDAIRYRQALLEHNTGNSEPAQRIASRFDEGKEDPWEEFDSRVLNQLLSVINNKKRHKPRAISRDEDQSGPSSLFDTGSLLKVATGRNE